MSLFKKAEKKKSFLRMSVAGPSGSGKTWTALTFAQALSPSGKIAVVDTEHGSASKYADAFSFDALELTNFHPNNYVQAIRDAVAGGYEVIVLDSITHAWNGAGGILSIVNTNFGKWKDVAPIEQAFIEALIGNPIHVIATMRAKTQYEVEKNERTGKPEPKKVGMGAIQREGMEYEFDIAVMMDVQNTLMVEKTRCPAVSGMVVNRPDGKFMQPIINWLSGSAPTPEPQRTPPPAHRNGTAQPAEPIWQTWPNVGAAWAWAVDIGACENKNEAENSWNKIKENHGGKLTAENSDAIRKGFYDRQMEKLAEKQQVPA